MKNIKMLEEAIQLAKLVHKNQVDKGGNPYIQHCLRVMNSMSSIEEKIVAVLHDAIEDTDLTFEELKINRKFPEEILEAIEAITRLEEEKYNSYIKRVINNPIALKVKIADLSDNIDLSRISNKSKKDIERTKVYKSRLKKLKKILDKKK